MGKSSRSNDKNSGGPGSRRLPGGARGVPRTYTISKDLILELHEFEKIFYLIAIDLRLLRIGQNILFLPGIHLLEQFTLGRIQTPGRGLANLIEKAYHIEELELLSKRLIFLNRKSVQNILLNSLDGFFHSRGFEKRQNITNHCLVRIMHQGQCDEPVPLFLWIVVKCRPVEP